VKSYQTAGIIPLGLSLDIARLAIVKDQFAVTCARSKKITIRRECYISDKSIVVGKHFIVFEWYGRVENDRIVI
jgi:hypothetical protein